MNKILTVVGVLILLGGVSGYLAVAAVGINGDLTPGHPVCGAAQNSVQDCATVGAVVLSPRGALTLSPTGNYTSAPGGTMTLSPTGAYTSSPGGTMTLSPVGNLSIAPSAGTATINPSGALALKVNGTAALSIDTSGFITLSQTNGGTAAKYVCVDSSGGVILQTAACQP